MQTNNISCLARTIASVAVLCLLPSTGFGHAGNTDQNGGHYYGNSYHCHMVGCEMPDTFNFGRVEVDLRRRTVTIGDVEHRLTTHEAGVLGYLISHRGRDVSREELLEKVWGYSPSMNTRTVDNQILKLRKKIENEPADPRHILTVHGKGYRFES